MLGTEGMIVSKISTVASFKGRILWWGREKLAKYVKLQVVKVIMKKITECYESASLEKLIYSTCLSISLAIYLSSNPSMDTGQEVCVYEGEFIRSKKSFLKKCLN